MPSPQNTCAHRTNLILNFAAIYLIWGSTYLAIKYAIETMPPFMMAGTRFVLASGILFFLSRLRREPWLKSIDVKLAALSGTLLVMGNALVCYSETSLPSGLAAVFVGTMPVWITLFSWKFFKGAKPRLQQFGGIALSLIGILFLTQSQSASGDGNFLSWMALAMSVISWAFGTLIQRKSTQRTSSFLFSCTQLGIGGVVLLAMWILSGGAKGFDITLVSTASVGSMLYLTVFGTVVAFSSYLWLNQNVEPTLISTYALVNPVVAVWLGWLFAGESVTVYTIGFSLLVIAGLYYVISKPKKVEAPFRAPMVEKKSQPC